MDESIELRDLRAIFQTAIKNEREAQHLYSEAAKVAAKGALKNIFLGLMRQEASHEKVLRREYRVLKKAIA